MDETSIVEGEQGLIMGLWNVSWIVGVPWLALLSVAYFVSKRCRTLSSL
jgi:hypothetical protein